MHAPQNCWRPPRGTSEVPGSGPSSPSPGSRWREGMRGGWGGARTWRVRAKEATPHCLSRLPTDVGRGSAWACLCLWKRELRLEGIHLCADLGGALPRGASELGEEGACFLSAPGPRPAGGKAEDRTEPPAGLISSPPTDVIHTVGPIAHGEPSASQAAELRSCYLSSLDLLLEHRLRSVVRGARRRGRGRREAGGGARPGGRRSGE